MTTPNIDVEKAARALVDGRGATYSINTDPPMEFVMIPMAHFDAIRSALSRSSRPAESGEAVAWQVVSADWQAWGLFDESSGGEQKAAEWRDEYQKRHAGRGPYRVVPLYARPTPPPAEVEAKLKEALRAETRRRQWARIYGCYVGWGIINSDEHAQGAKAILGVIATDENFGGPYRRHKETEAYVPQPTNLGAVSPEEAERAECAAIDKMIAAAEAAERAERETGGGGE